ncbi:hypothetical protein O6H91_10G076500 [Diphasiastrum complanatum]|uniref:Uncharacterized protein n=1 Tax=Diphasiastrum complanatum TaxID=34168 RepID=A0ACC2CIB4_DIPCM|nr:hypothetical protein O6H91_10G076500 [Diphasiastrum complanatum]
MFKKPTEAKALQRLSGADRKKLRRSIRDRFTQAAEADIDAVLPPKGEISVAKLSNRAHVFIVDGGLPMLFDVDNRGSEIYPTVFALWKVPTLLPAFVLKGAEVSRYVLGGADLMFPGITIPSEGLASFGAGETWAVKVPGNPYPIAVGTTAMSLMDATKAGFRGKALRVTHYYRDSLWEAAEGRYIPNAGFLEDIVLEDPAVKAAAQSQMTSTSSSSEARDFDTERLDDKVETVSILKDSTKSDLSVDSDRPLSVNSEEIVATEVHDLRIQEDYHMDDVATSVAPVTVDEMDNLLDKCLLQALHTTLKDKDLPMSGSTLWSSHVIACRPPGSVLDIKKSSHKKLSKWLQVKSSIGLISVKEDKHRKEVMILAINKQHSDYLGFKPEKRVSSLEGAARPVANDQSQEKVQLEVSEVWKPSSHVNPIFEAMGVDFNKYYNFLEASNVIFAYVQKENLAKKDDESVIVLDATLCDALYKGTVKKGSTYPAEINKKDLEKTFISRMQAHHKVTRGTESILRKGALRSVQIVTERRQGNKKVTRVSGLESFLVDAELLAAELQKKFACSTSVTELPGKRGQYEVLVQGGVLEDLGRHLVQHYSIPKKFIEILDKTKR